MQLDLASPFAFPAFAFGAGLNGGGPSLALVSAMRLSGPADFAGTPDLEDIRIIRRMAAGESGAVGACYDRWSGKVYAVAISILRVAQDAEEIVEETFAQAWDQASRFDSSRGSAGSWLLNIARSRALDRLKRIKRRREELSGSLEPSLAVDTTDALQSLIAEERSAAVARALGALPEAQRAAIEMAYFGGLSQTEIAECTGEALGTVKTRMRLAMQKLRERLSPMREATA